MAVTKMNETRSASCKFITGVDGFGKDQHTTRTIANFKTESLLKVTLRVGVPRDDIEADDIKTVMELIIAKNVIHSSAGDLIEIDSAYLVETSTTEYDVVI